MQSSNQTEAPEDVWYRVNIVQRKFVHVPFTTALQRPTTLSSNFMLPLHLRASVDDLRGGLVRVLLEVVLEQLAELGDLAGEVGGAGPALLGVEELVGHARARLGHGQVEDVVGLVVDLGELAAVDGVEDGAGVLEWAALAW